MKRRILALFLALALGLPACALASVGDTAGEIYTVFTEDGATLFQIAGAVSVGDEYISAENQLYEIISVDEQHKTAVARLVGAEEMPDVSWLNAEQDAVSVYAQAEKKLIALYVTHGDESYVPTDGTESEEDGGGIYDVAKQFKAELEASLAEMLLALPFGEATLVRWSRCLALLLDCEGVEDYSAFTVNGGTTNLSVTQEQTPVVGTVTITEGS